MSGLLGDFSDPQGMANLALAAGLLSPGSFGQGLGRGLQGYQGTLANAQDMQLRQQQIAAAQQEQQVRELAMQRTRQQLQFGQSFLGDAGGAAPVPQSPASTAMGAGAQTGSVGPTVANAQRMDAAPLTITPPQKSKLESLTQDQIAAGVVSGVIPKELVELWTNSKFGRALPPGWKQNLDGSMMYVPDPTKGLTMGADNKTVVAMPGAADAQAALAGATTTATERAKNAQTLVPIDRLNAGGVPGMGPASSIDEILHPTPMSGFQPSARAAIARDSGGGPINVQSLTAPEGARVNLPASGVSSTFKTAADQAAEAEKAKALAVQPINFATKVNNDAHTNNQKTMGDLADVTNNESEIVARNARIQPFIAKLDKAGGFAYDERVNLANDLKNSGIPGADTLSKLVLTGNPADAKTVQNQLAAAAIQTMLDTLNKEGKPNRAIFNAVEAQKEALASGKDVLSNVMDLQKQLYDQHVTQLGGMTDLMSSPNYNPVKFQYQFATQKQNTISAPAAAPAPAPTTFKMLPAASQYTGKRMKSDDGTIYRSDGKTWTKE